MLSTVKDFFVGKAIINADAKAVANAGAYTTFMDGLPVGTIFLVNQQNKILLDGAVRASDYFVNATTGGTSNTPVRATSIRVVQKIGKNGNGFIPIASTATNSAPGKYRWGTIINYFDNNSQIHVARRATVGQGGQGAGVFWRTSDIGRQVAYNTPTILSFHPELPCTVCLNLNGGLIPTTSAGIYCLHIVYKNVRDLSPNQFRKVYEVSKGAGEAMTSEAIRDKFIDLINNDDFSKVKASAGSTASTGNPISIFLEAKIYDHPFNNRYEYAPISFEASVSKRALGNIATATPEVAFSSVIDSQTRGGQVGAGNPKIVGDEEKRAQAQLGITNWVHFPVQLPKMYTKEDVWYDCLSCDFADAYMPADNMYPRYSHQHLKVYLEGGTNSAPINANNTSFGLAFKASLNIEFTPY